MINSSKQAKLEAEKADAREQIELVLSDAYIDKNLNDKYDENEYLNTFIKDRLKNVIIEEKRIGLNGFLFELDRSVPRLGKYIGQATGPIINEINVTDKTTNSISIEVNTSNAENADYTYLYKKNEETEWIEAGKGKENTFKYDNLESDKIYNIKVIVETKGGKTEQETNERTGEMPTGKITFGDVTWQDGLATVTIHTEETGYTLQYQIDNALEEGWQTIENGGAVSNLQLNQTVYARLFDGKNGTEPASESIKDGVSPLVTVTKGEINTNSIAVSVQAVDNESGMKKSPTYTYYIKKTSEEDTAYQVKATGVTATTYTFTGLQQETSYDIKVEVNGDKAGNVGTGTLAGQTTTKVPGGEAGVQQGAITFGATTWSGGKASITISTNTGMQIQYQVGGTTEGSWKNISNEGTVSNLQHGQTVYARLTDGTNYGDYASESIVDGTAPNAPTISLSGTSGNNSYYKSNVTVKITAGSDGQSGANKIRYKVTGAQTIAQTDTTAGTTSTSITISTNGTSTITAYTIDKAGNVSEEKTQVVYKDSTAPSTANLTVGTVGETTIAVTAKGADSTSGVYSYQFQRSTTSSTSGFTTVATKTSTATSYSYTYTGLTAGTTYYLRVIVTDKAGNKKTGTAVTQATNKKVATNINEFVAGDYVTYPSPKGDLACRVLYDSSSGYGVQLITSDTVTDSYTLGTNGDFDGNKTLYNKVINTLNSAVSSYNNSTYSTVRCVGSVPNNPSQDSAGYHTTKFDSEYDGQFKDTDTNYKADYDQMGTLGIRNIGKYYWLASRYVNSNSGSSNFNVRDVNSSGSLGNYALCYVYSGGSTSANSDSNGLRPVFTLKSDIKVTGGNGESGTPYTLGV